MSKDDDYENFTVRKSTGEIIPGLDVKVPKTNSYFKETCTMHLPAFEEIATRLKPEPMRVLLVMMAHVGYDNRIEVGQRDLAARLNISTSRVSRGIKSIIEEGFIVEVPNIAKGKTYMISPYNSWRGNIPAHWKAIKNMRKSSKGNFGIIDGDRAHEPKIKRIS